MQIAANLPALRLDKSHVAEGPETIGRRAALAVPIRLDGVVDHHGHALIQRQGLLHR